MTRAARRLARSGSLSAVLVAAGLSVCLTPIQPAAATRGSGPSHRGPQPAAPPRTPLLKKGAEPLVIGHRGDPGNRPEHTLTSYRLAIRRGADYVETDLVATKNGRLIARHESNLAPTTDIASRHRYRHLERTRVIHGRRVRGWFSQTLTLKQVKGVRAVERMPHLRPQNVKYNGRYQVPTFSRVLDLVEHMRKVEHRRVGIYAELKAPHYSRAHHLPMEGTVVDALKAHHMDRASSHVLLECYSPASLRRLNRITHVHLVQLLNRRGQAYDGTHAVDHRYPDLANRAGLAKIRRYAQGIGVPKRLVIPVTTRGRLAHATSLVGSAHRDGLFVHAFVFRDENVYLPPALRRGAGIRRHGHSRKELDDYFDAGVDGVFDDYPGTAYDARRLWEKGQH